MTECSTTDRLQEIMKIRNLKQIDILELCKPYCDMHHIKLTKSALSQYISGKSQPGQSKLSILSMALDVDVAWLMGYDVPIGKSHFISRTKKSNNTNELQNIADKYDEQTKQALDLYAQLDADDRAEIRGEMKQMLKAEKYLAKDVSSNKKMA